MKFLTLAPVLLAGCAAGPNYKRPDLPVPPRFRHDAEPPTTPSLAETKWFDLFQDPILNDLIRTAIAKNYDLRIAAERVLQARAQLGITRSEIFPTVDGRAQFTSARNSQTGSARFLPRGTNTDVSYTQTGFGLSWELDLWGRIRRLTESARADYLASEEARHGVLTTLVADVTRGYFSLRELDLELEIARKTLAIAQNGLRLTTLRHERGVVTGLDVHQAEELLYTATAQIAASERAIAQQENGLSFLIGAPPGEIARGKALEELTAPALVPAGLPSSLLTRRPDIRGAEQTLISANARLGAARAQYFPQISLTGFLGTQSRQLTDLFIGPAQQFSFAPAALMPIFNAGRLRANVRFTEAARAEALASYERSIQNAFREVSDALTGYRKTVEQRTQQELLVRALRERNRLSLLRYQGGLDSYLQVLDAQRNQFQGELSLARLRREELLSVIQLYRALGGGWQS
ncbi:MAG TPA: efflux transporter outer membrane subunit [Bryobacteraceae bacterium]|nr:efflux transporter outer membrane subunit [Bryobacteraceae bacterium]